LIQLFAVKNTTKFALTQFLVYHGGRFAESLKIIIFSFSKTYTTGFALFSIEACTLRHDGEEPKNEEA
jgi:hypothetical protein